MDTLRLETQVLFSVLKNLTSKSDAQDLILALRDELNNHFDDALVAVYELHAIRQPHNREQRLTGMDCLKELPPLQIDAHPAMSKAYDTHKEVRNTSPANGSEVIFPIELYDNSISHLVKLNHGYKDCDDEDVLVGLVGIFRDIFRSIHERGYDPLTRILNRQAFDMTVSKLASEACPLDDSASDSDKQYSFIAIFDIDRFKSINDQYGHALGDETLVLFAQTIRSVSRQQDLFFRYGGEEFVLFLYDVNFLRASKVLERCREAVETKRFPQVGQVTVSVGFAKLENNIHPLENLSRADKALYYAKNNGRNQIHSYDKLLAKSLITPVEALESQVDFWD